MAKKFKVVDIDDHRRQQRTPLDDAIARHVAATHKIEELEGALRNAQNKLAKAEKKLGAIETMMDFIKAL